MNFAGLFKYFTEKTLEEKRITEIETEIGYTITNISSNLENCSILLGKNNLNNFTAIYIYYRIIYSLRENKDELTKSKIDELFKKIKELEIPIIEKISSISYGDYIRNNDMNKIMLCEDMKKLLFQLDYYFKIIKIFLYKEEL